jgi:RimJ/RimL family protein N-acetyltransferase
MSNSELGRLQLLPYAESDQGFFMSLFCDERVMRYIGGAMTREGAAERFALLLSGDDPRVHQAWKVVDRAGQELGHAVLLRAPNDAVEIGFALAPSSWGRGYATAVAIALCDRARAHFPSAQIIATVDSEHLASQRVLQKAGLRKLREEQDEDGTFLLYDYSPA